jgi:hypothetical protein
MASLAEADFLAPDVIVQLGVEPCRIDLLTGIDGVEFNAAWQHKVVIKVDDLVLPVLSKADLLKNKLVVNRDKDQSDIAWLEKNQSGTV